MRLTYSVLEAAYGNSTAGFNRKVAAAYLAVCLLALGCGGSGKKEEPHAKKWNVLLVTVDTLRADRLEPYGYDKIKTPAWNELAAKGVVFEQAVTTSPTTLPAHATLMTGLYPARHGALDNGLFSLKEDVPTLAEAFRRGGWRTGAFVSAFVLDRRYNLDRGFDFYDDRVSEKEAVFRFAERRAEDTAREALRWILRGDRSLPFFAWIHFFDPHKEYAPPEPFASEYRDSPYDGEVAYADHVLAQVLAVLRHERLLESTIIVATSDHGESLGEHGEDTHGFFLYDATARIPLVIAHPDGGGGRRFGRQVKLADVPLTLLDLAGLPVLAGADGRSLASVMEGGDIPAAPSYLEATAGHFLYGWPVFRGVRTESYKYLEGVRRELYDLTADPHELNNRLSSSEGESAATTLRGTLRDIVASFPSPDAPRAVSKEEEERLRSLGYLGGAAPPIAKTEGLSNEKLMTSVRALTLAQNLLAAGKTNEGIAELRKAIRENPANYDAHRLLGEAYLNTGMFEKGLAALDRAVTLARAFNPNLHLNRAQCLAGMGRHGEALHEIDEVLSRAPRHVEGHLLGAQLAYGQEMFEDARHRYEALLRFAPEHPKALVLSASLLLRDKEWDEAFARFERAARVLNEAPTRDTALLALALTGMGSVHAAKLNCAGAREFLLAAIQVDPEQMNAYFYLGQCAYTDGDFPTAIRYLTRYLVMDRNPESASHQSALSMLATAKAIVQ